MKNTILSLLVFTLLIGCNKKQKTTKHSNPVSNTKTTTTVDDSKLDSKNYAITWKWTSKNSEFIQDNLPTIDKELTQLWKKGIVENAYYDADAKVDKFDYFPNVAFFLKAHSKTKAKSILDDLAIVKKGIASYEIHPVGKLWLDRKTDLINEKGITKSFVAVCTRLIKREDTDTKVSELQSESVLELWNKGVIENAYFDLEKEQQSNDMSDFVFFVNTNTKKEAEDICNSLPYFSKGIATYKLHQVGVFWRGKHEN